MANARIGRWFGRGGLQREIVWYLALLAVLSVLIVGFVLTRILGEMLREQAVSHARTVGSLATQIVQVGWDPMRRDGAIGGAMERLAERTDFDQWTLFSRDGTWLAGAPAPKIDPEKMARMSAGEQPWIEQLERNVHAYHNIERAGSVVGTLRLVFEDKTFERAFKKSVSAILFYVLTFALVLIVFGYRLIRHVVVDPLKRIERAAREIAAGNTGQVVAVDGENEIGRLGTAIESMRRHLISDQEKLADYAQSLEKLNFELEESQRALLRGEKLASVGRLAAGVAHEVGNPLGAVIGYLSLIKGSISEPEVLELLGRSEAELTRISRIIRQLLDYSRPMPVPDEPCDVEEVIRTTVEAIRAQGLPPGVHVELDLAGRLPPLWINSDPLRQILWNLLLNATDAVSQGGAIHVKGETLSAERLRGEPLGSLFQARTRRGDFPRPQVMEQRRQKRSGDQGDAPVEQMRGEKGRLPAFLFEGGGDVVRIIVQDSGRGIRTEELGKIFDPFFTTKPPGKGTGLGLFITLNLVEALGGFLDVRTNADQGSAFIVVLPVKFDRPLT